MCWVAARAQAPQLVVGAGGGAGAWRRRSLAAASAATPVARAALQLLHAPATRAAVAFPHPRLLQYDCGECARPDPGGPLDARRIVRIAASSAQASCRRWPSSSAD